MNRALLVTTEEGGDYIAVPQPYMTKFSVHSVFFEDGSVWDATIAARLPDTGGWRHGADRQRAEEYARIAAGLRSQ